VYVIPDGSVPLVPNVGIVVGRRATLVIDRTFLAFGQYSSAQAWVAALDQLAPLGPAHIVPSHGPMGDASRRRSC
jgi:hypothetical protein